MSLRAAVQTIRDRTLRFTLVERFRERDPFEGTVPLTVQAQLDVPIMGYYHRHNQQQQLAAHFDKDIRDLLRERPRATPIRSPQSGVNQDHPRFENDVRLESLDVFRRTTG